MVACPLPELMETFMENPATHNLIICKQQK